MAGHSQFKNIMHRKGAQDKKRAKIFTKIAKEITVAVQMGGSDAQSNPRLRSAISDARDVNMPKDNIERAVKRATGNDKIENYEEIRYEGYAPEGVAVIVEALTDNRNRTASDVRSTFTKNAGNLGESGSVNFMFSKNGVITISMQVAQAKNIGFDDIFNNSINYNATDVLQEEDAYLVLTEVENLQLTLNGLIKDFNLQENEIAGAISWLPKHFITIDNLDTANNIIKLINALEDLDDVQKVYANFNFTPQIMESL